MKTLQDTPTAELLAEIKYLTNKKSHPQVNWATNEEKAVLIAAELDRRCVDAGVSIDRDGIPNFANCGHARDGSFTLYSHATRENVSAKELRDLLTWLLTKGGNG